MTTESADTAYHLMVVGPDGEEILVPLVGCPACQLVAPEIAERPFAQFASVPFYPDPVTRSVEGWSCPRCRTTEAKPFRRASWDEIHAGSRLAWNSDVKAFQVVRMTYQLASPCSVCGENIELVRCGRCGELAATCVGLPDHDELFYPDPADLSVHATADEFCGHCGRDLLGTFPAATWRELQVAGYDWDPGARAFVLGG